MNRFDKVRAAAKFAVMMAILDRGRLLEDEDDSDYEEEEDDDNDEEEAEDDEEEKDRQKRRFEQVKKIVETSKTTNLKSRQDISTTVPRAMGQRNPSGRLVCAPDLSSSVNASSSLIDPLVLPGTSQTESILPMRIETESSSVSLVYEPHKAPKIEVEEEEIEEFGGESREICEEKTHIVSDLHTENLKEILLRLRAEKLVMELEKLKMDRKKLEAEKRNIGLRTKVLELRKKLASLESDEDEGRPLTSLPRADKSSEPRSEDFSPLPNESIFLRTSAIVQEDPLSDLNTMAKRVSSPLVKSATSGRSERKKAQSQLKKPVQQETSDQLCQVRRKSSDTVTKDDGMFSKSPAESIDVPGISNAPLHLHGTTDVKEEELSGDSLDSSNPGILESLLKVKQTEPQFPRLEGAKYVHEHREEETDSSFIHGSNINVCGSTHVGTEDDFAGPLAKRMKYADGPS